MSTPTELYRKHRPQIFKGLHGQESAVSTLKSFLVAGKTPHALLFSGPSGCGKTTLARIMKDKLKCGDADFCEMNCADFSGIDMVRDIRSRMGLSPISGSCRIWLIDEAHQMTSAAQNAFLKMLEDTPSHVYFFIATTDPQKLLPTIRTRCTEISVKSLGRPMLTSLLEEVIAAEGKADAVQWEEVLSVICDNAEGSARKALVLLNAVIGLPSADDMIAAVKSTVMNPKAIELARILLDGRATWKEVAGLLKGIEEDPESLRWMILGYMSNVCLGAGPKAARAWDIINIFERNFYDSKKAGLVAACYGVVHRK